MKSLFALALLASFSAPSASAADEWETVQCSYKRNRIPDDDRGTWCRHFYTCRDQGKRAFIQYTDNTMNRFCCVSKAVGCTDTYGGN